MNTEIICQFDVSSPKNSGYFLLDSRVSYSQFLTFIHKNIHNDECSISGALGTPISSEEELRASLDHALLAGNAMTILITPIVSEPIKSNEPVVSENTFGPILTGLLTQFGINVDEQADPMEMVNQIPFPFSMIIRSNVENLCNNPDTLAQYVQTLSATFGLPQESLLTEVQQVAHVMKERHFSAPAPAPAPVPQEQNVPEESVNSPAPVFGPMVKTLLLEFGIEVDDNIDPLEIINSLPFPFGQIVNSKLALILEEPEILEDAVRGISICFGVSFDDLFEEAKTSVIALRQRMGLEEVKEVPTSPPSVVIHPASCDKCGQGIVDIRYKCIQCHDYDLCMTCEGVQAHEHFHDASHIFAKMYKPSISPISVHPNLSQPISEPFSVRIEVNEPSPVPVRRCPRIEALESSVNELKALIESLKQ